MGLAQQSAVLGSAYALSHPACNACTTLGSCLPASRTYGPCSPGLVCMARRLPAGLPQGWCGVRLCCGRGQRRFRSLQHQACGRGGKLGLGRGCLRSLTRAQNCCSFLPLKPSTLNQSLHAAVLHPKHSWFCCHTPRRTSLPPFPAAPQCHSQQGHHSGAGPARQPAAGLCQRGLTGAGRRHQQ